MRQIRRAFVAAALVSCAQSRSAPEPGDPPSERPSQGDQAGEQESEERITATCEGLQVAGPLGHAWWLDGQAADCAEMPTHTPRAPYDDCEFPQDASSLERCGVEPRGTPVCRFNAHSGRGRVTATCLSAADCPEGMVCTVDGRPVDNVDHSVSWAGYCEKRCVGSDPGECVRCDMECKAEYGVCGQRSEPEPSDPCTVDCECPEGICLQGVCRPDASAARSGVCGVEGDCACTGGDCVNGCCMLQDGQIARHDSAACTGDPAN